MTKSALTPKAPSEVVAERRNYAYDNIGNRTSSANAGQTADLYCSNSLNQYTDIGTSVACPPTTPTLTYDLDGNMTADGTQTYEWDGENRLKTVYPTNPQTDSKKCVFAYDYMSRRVRKTVYNYSGSTWNESTDQLFVYDDWNVVLVLDANADNATLRKYAWGLDLSGQNMAQSLSIMFDGIYGAGGIGGLLACVETSGTNDGSYWYIYDGNGNVGQVLNAADYSNAARYEYDSYGNIIGPDVDGDGQWIDDATAFAHANPIRFSTKWFDDETGLGCWGYRYFLPRFGRWLSRDLIGEAGGINLLNYVWNNTINYWDPYGLAGDVIGLPPYYNRPELVETIADTAKMLKCAAPAVKDAALIATGAAAAAVANEVCESRQVDPPGIQKPFPKPYIPPYKCPKQEKPPRPGPGPEPPPQKGPDDPIDTTCKKKAIAILIVMLLDNICGGEECCKQSDQKPTQPPPPADCRLSINAVQPGGGYYCSYVCPSGRKMVRTGSGPCSKTVPDSGQ